MNYGRKLTLAELSRFVVLAAPAWFALVSPNASVAQAQPQTQTPPPAPSDGKDATSKDGATVQGVTVTARTDDFRSAIDRKSYDITKDLQAQAGAPIADALRNLPGVQVDTQGNVSIRGDADVTILVDGKPSSQFEGPGKAQALQSLPADQYERVEMMTNPSAEFSPNGSAGILNLISKTSHKPTDSGSVRAMLGADGRWNLGLNATYHADKATYTLSAGQVHNVLVLNTEAHREGFNSAGAPTFSTVESVSDKGDPLFTFGRAAVDYDFDAQSRLSANLHAFSAALDTRGLQSIVNGGGGGAQNGPGAANDESNSGSLGIVSLGGEISYRRNFSGDQHDLTLSVSRDRESRNFSAHFDDADLIPPPPDLFNTQLSSALLYRSVVKADYEQPMPASGQFKAGYEFDNEDDRFSDSDFNDAAPPAGPLGPGQTNLFRFNRTIQAFYATYQQPLGKWTVLGGLRLETSHIDIDQATQHLTSNQQDWRLYPTLHLAYEIDDAQQLTASYSQRIERPAPEAFNPARELTIQGPLDLSAGNPDLRPQQTQSYELGYQYKKGASYYLATLFYKDNSDGLTPVEEEFGGGVVVTTQENFARSRSGGLELAASGKIGASLTYNVSGDASWNQLDATPLGFQTRQTGFALAGRGSINWQATANDLFQINGNLQSRQLTAQGFIGSTGQLFAGYRHKLSPQLTLFVVGQDLLNSERYRVTLDTPALKSDSDLRQRSRAILIGLTWSFGGATKRDPDFDFGGGGGPH
jgi:outer membrane receptor protein involved in Fe transport